MINRTFALILLCLLAGTAHASDTRYRIEMVFFAHTDDKAFLSEQWPQPQAAASAAEGSREENTTRRFAELPADEQKLGGAVAQLDKSKRYRVLKHIAWEQPGLSEDRAVSVPISGGTDFRMEFPARMESRWIVDANGQMVEIPGPESLNEMDGSVRLVLGRYLHIYTDLVYRKPVIVEQLDEETQEVSEQQILFDIPVESHRKMRSRELHYLDHPLLGILIEVTPVETAEQSS